MSDEERMNRRPNATTFSVKVPKVPAEAREVVGRVLRRSLNERAILTSPGVAEGFDRSYQLIEDWEAHGAR